MSKYKIIDNFLIEPYFQSIKDYFEHHNMPWYYSDSVVYGDKAEKEDKNAYQFTNTLYNYDFPSQAGLDMLEPLLNELKIFSLIRIKVNFNPVRQKPYESAYHYDNADFSGNDLPYTVGIFNLTTNNGYTELKIGKETIKIPSVENTMILLAGDVLHRGVSSTDYKRMLINMNFINKDTKLLYGHS